MDVRKLLYLIEVIERGSLGKASVALGVSQPALTKALRLLESDVEAQLLERSPAGVLPTEFGRSLYAHAKAIVAELDRAQSEIAQLKGEENKYVRIASLPSISVLVARGVANTVESGKERLVRVVEMQNYQLLPALRRGEYDFVIGLADAVEPEPAIRQRVIGRDRLVFAVRRGHALLRRKSSRCRTCWRFHGCFRSWAPTSTFQPSAKCSRTKGCERQFLASRQDRCSSSRRWCSRAIRSRYLRNTWWSRSCVSVNWRRCRSLRRRSSGRSLFRNGRRFAVARCARSAGGNRGGVSGVVGVGGQPCAFGKILTRAASLTRTCITSKREGAFGVAVRVARSAVWPA